MSDPVEARDPITALATAMRAWRGDYGLPFANDIPDADALYGALRAIGWDIRSESAGTGLDVETRQLIRELAETVHQTGLIRDHSDPTDETGWHVKGIETCADLLCVDALARLSSSDTDR